MCYRNAFSAQTESLGDDGAVVSAGEMRFCGLPWRSTENVASLAFRAEDVQLAASGIPAEVAQVEYCGPLWLADLRLAAGALVAMLTHKRVRVGGRVRFQLSLDRIRMRLEARRLGKEWYSPCRLRVAPY